MEGFCQVYRGATCSKFLANRTIFVQSSLTQGIVEEKLAAAFTVIAHSGYKNVYVLLPSFLTCLDIEDNAKIDSDCNLTLTKEIVCIGFCSIYARRVRGNGYR